MANESTEIQAVNFDDFVGKDIFCTVDLTTIEGKKVAANAVNAATSLKDLGDKKFTLVDVVTTPGVRSQTGETCINVYLIDNKGKAYFSQSTGIFRSAQNLAGIFNGDFGDGIDVKVVATPTNTGNTVKTLMWL